MVLSTRILLASRIQTKMRKKMTEMSQRRRQKRFTLALTHTLKDPGQWELEHLDLARVLCSERICTLSCSYRWSSPSIRSSVRITNKLTLRANYKSSLLMKRRMMTLTRKLKTMKSWKHRGILRLRARESLQMTIAPSEDLLSRVSPNIRKTTDQSGSHHQQATYLSYS